MATRGPVIARWRWPRRHRMPPRDAKGTETNTSHAPLAPLRQHRPLAPKEASRRDSRDARSGPPASASSDRALTPAPRWRSSRRSRSPSRSWCSSAASATSLDPRCCLCLRLSGKGVLSDALGSLAGMGARFIGGDREQVFLMPPSVRDWVPEGHLVWTVLDAVAELDLSAIYGDYRADGHGRPAYEPSMMVALLLYAYTRGNRSSRGIERACVEDVAFRVVAGNVAPDHSTIAEFRCRHEQPLGEVFCGVLGLCAGAGLVSVGVVAIDGTKMAANASSDANRDFGQIAREILAEAAEIDAREDELYGDQRGDELPEQLRTREGRRQALREAKERLGREREQMSESQTGGEPPTLELDPGQFVTRPQGRRAWVREGRRALDAAREREGRPIAKDRTDRLFEACRRLE